MSNKIRFFLVNIYYLVRIFIILLAYEKRVDVDENDDKALELCQSGVVACRQRPLLEGNSCEVLLLGDTYHLLQLRRISFRLI